MQTSSQQTRRPRMRWRRLAEAAFYGAMFFCVFGYLYWQFWAVIFSPAAAWVITALICIGLPAAFLCGRIWRTSCRGCREREASIRLLEYRVIEVLRERDRLRARLHNSLFRTTCGKSK